MYWINWLYVTMWTSNVYKLTAVRNLRNIIVANIGKKQQIIWCYRQNRWLHVQCFIIDDKTITDIIKYYLNDVMINC